MSDEHQHPVLKAIFEQFLEIFAKIVMLVIAAAIVLLFFPFELKSTIPTIILLLLAFGLFLSWRKENKVRALIVSAFLIFIATAWACISPALLAEKPIYYIENYSNILSIEELLKGNIPITIVKSVSEQSKGGTIISIGDPIRKWTLPYFIRVFYPESGLQLRLDKTPKNLYVVFPMRLALRFNTLYNPEVYQPMVVLTFSTEYVPAEDEHAEIGVGIGAKHTKLFDYYSSQKPDVALWNAVEIPDAMPVETLRFVALLDEAIEKSANGDTQTVTDLLLEAANLAPNSVEKARIFCLLSSYYQSILPGSLGMLQSIPFANQAFSLLNPPALAQNASWLETWVARSLADRYREFGALYEGRINELERVGETTASSFSSFHLPPGFYRQGGIEILQPALDSMRLYLQRVQEMRLGFGTIGEEQARLIALSPEGLKQELAAARSPETKSHIIDLVVSDIGDITSPVAVASPNTDSRLDILENVSDSLPSPYKEHYSKRVAVERFKIRTQKYAQDANLQSFRELVPDLSTIFPQLKSNYGLVYSNLLESAFAEGDTGQVRVLLPPSDRTWWATNALLWEQCEILNYLKSYTPGPGARSYRNLTRGVGDPMRFVADSSGNVFLPAMAIAALGTEDEDSPEHRRFVSELESALGVSYDLLKKYLDSSNRSRPDGSQ